MNKVKILIIWFIFTAFPVLFFGNIYANRRISNIKSAVYRSHDRYIVPEKDKYESNVDSLEVNYYGDLCHISGLLDSCFFTEGLRNHRFKSDSLGYKTLGNIKNSDFVLIGDSFLAASGGDEMNEQLGYVLSELTGKKIYEAAVPGNISNYIKRKEKINKISKNPKKFIFLVFEGNDFTTVNQPKQISRLNQFIRSFKKSFIYRMPLSKLLRTKFKMEFSKHISTKELYFMNSDASVFIENINNRNNAFYKPYIKNSKVDLKIPNVELDKLISYRSSICGVVYIPTKNSVYRLSNSTQQRHPTLYSQFDILNKNQIEVLDLTIPLRKKITQESPNNYLWWADDTHWNKNGINEAAKFLKSQLSCLN